jgi:hypothetical protein
MNRRPLKFITREKEWELIQRLETIVDSSEFDPSNTAIVMASPDYSATVAMHLAHSWSRGGDMLNVIPVDVTYPDESSDYYIRKMKYDFDWYLELPKKLVLVEAGIIRGSNWEWMLDVLYGLKYTREDITLVALCENVNSRIKSDYVGEYYNDDTEELMFYFEKYNKHWPIK